MREEVKNKYRQVACNPRSEYHFHTGSLLAQRLGHEEDQIVKMPDSAVESFAGVEGDWSLTFAEPIPTEDWSALVRAASIAFRTPNVGRRLYGYARAAGFSDVKVSVVCRPDVTGRLLPMVRNLGAYARHSASLDDARIDAVVRQCEKAAAEEKFFIFAPQFLVTATR